MSTRCSTLKLALCGLVLAAAALPLASSPAAAHSSSRVFLGFGFNGWGPPAYYYPPPYYYYPPPPVVYAPPPAYGTAQPTPAAPTGQTCREYQSIVTVDGQAQPSYGTACLQPDGTWRIIN